MRRGEVWWVEFDERRPVVLLSEDEPRFRAMQVVAPADTDFSGLGIEVAVGVPEGLPFEGVLRFAFPWPGFTPCTWLTTLSRDDLIEREGAVSTAKLSEIDDALRASEQRTEWTPAAAARLSEINESLRRRTQTYGEGTDAHTGEGRSRPTTDGPRRLSNKITIYGWSTSPFRWSLAAFVTLHAPDYCLTPDYPVSRLPGSIAILFSI